MDNITKEIKIELRQKNRYTSNAGIGSVDQTGQIQHQNGDYSVEINEPIDIEEGDIVQVTEVFVDDNSTGLGLINIEEDITGALEAYQYFYDVQPSSHYSSDGATKSCLNIRGYQPTVAGVSNPAVQHPDGKHYFLSEITKTSSGGGAGTAQNIFLCSELNLTFDRYVATAKSVDVYFQYEMPLGTQKIVGLTLKKDALAKIQADAVITLNQDNLPLLLVTDGKTSGNPQHFKFPFLFASNKTGVAGGDNYLSESPANDESATKIKLNTTGTHGKDHTRDMKKSGVLGLSLPAYTQQNPVNGWELVTEPKVMSLVSRTVNFFIPKGKYDPDVLAQRINQQIVGVGNNLDNNYITQNTDDPQSQVYDSNSFLTTTVNIFNSGSGLEAERSPYFIREDGAQISQYIEAPTFSANYWVGASNFGVTYAGAGRFVFSNLHQSIYTTTGSTSNKVVRVEEMPSIPGREQFYLANKCGGIVLKDLRPNGFWFGDESIMGFSKTILATPSTKKLAFDIPDPTGHVVPPAPGAGSQSCQAEFFEAGQIIEGVNSTCDLNSLDVLVSKTANELNTAFSNATPFYDRPGLSPAGVNSAVSQFIGIYGHDVMNTEAQSNAYYKIEISMDGVTSDLRGADQGSNRIQAIIGRYYSGATFTQSVGGEGSIPYVHKGPPQKLSHFGVRVLMPDGSLANLADDNTVFLTITKKK